MMTPKRKNLLAELSIGLGECVRLTSSMNKLRENVVMGDSKLLYLSLFKRQLKRVAEQVEKIEKVNFATSR